MQSKKLLSPTAKSEGAAEAAPNPLKSLVPIPCSYVLIGMPNTALAASSIASDNVGCA